MNKSFVRLSFGAFAVLVLLFTSCYTMTKSQVAQAALTTSDQLSFGEVDALVGGSGTPFLFETEILTAPIQLQMLWDGLAQSGYGFVATAPVDVLDVDNDTWRRFSSSREVEVWFERHAPAKTALAVVPTAAGRLVIIIDRDRRFPARIRGLKVEQE